MSATRDTGGADRRSFLKLAGFGALTGAAVLGAGKGGAEASEAKPENSGLYRETDQVKTYYESARF